MRASSSSMRATRDPALSTASCMTFDSLTSRPRTAEQKALKSSYHAVLRTSRMLYVTSCRRATSLPNPAWAPSAWSVNGRLRRAYAGLQ